MHMQLALQQVIMHSIAMGYIAGRALSKAAINKPLHPLSIKIIAIIPDHYGYIIYIACTQTLIRHTNNSIQSLIITTLMSTLPFLIMKVLRMQLAII